MLNLAFNDEMLDFSCLSSMHFEIFFFFFSFFNVHFCEYNCCSSYAFWTEASSSYRCQYRYLLCLCVRDLYNLSLCFPLSSPFYWPPFVSPVFVFLQKKLSCYYCFPFSACLSSKLTSPWCSLLFLLFVPE